MFRNPSVAGDWTALCDRLNRSDALARWSRCESGLAGLTSVEQLAELLAPRSGTRPEHADALLGALVRVGCAAGGNDPDGVLVVVHLLAEGLYSIAARLGDLSDDALALAVGEMTAQIRAWPLRRTRAYAANLLRDTYATCLRELRPHRTRTYPRGGDILIDPLDEHATRRWMDATMPGPGESAAWELADVLTWARRCRIASQADLMLLVALERHRGYGTSARGRVAAAFGIHESTLHRRCHRVLSALRAAAPSYLAEPASLSDSRVAMAVA